MVKQTAPQLITNGGLSENLVKLIPEFHLQSPKLYSIITHTTD